MTKFYINIQFKDGQMSQFYTKHEKVTDINKKLSDLAVMFSVNDEPKRITAYDALGYPVALVLYPGHVSLVQIGILEDEEE